jgi:hypothetical protein
MVAVHAAPDVWHYARQLARQANRSLSVVQQRHSRGSTALALGRVPEQAGAAAAIPGGYVKRRDLKCEQKSVKTRAGRTDAAVGDARAPARARGGCRQQQCPLSY